MQRICSQWQGSCEESYIICTLQKCPLSIAVTNMTWHFHPRTMLSYTILEFTKRNKYFQHLLTDDSDITKPNTSNTSNQVKCEKPHWKCSPEVFTRIMSRQNISHKPFIIHVTSVTPVLPSRVHGPCISPKSIVKSSFPIIHRFWNGVFFMPN